MEFCINISMSCIETAISDHFEMFFRDMPDETFNEIYSRNSLFDILIVFMSIIVEGDIFAIIFINARSCNNRSAKITTDIFRNSFRVAFIVFGIHIKTVFMFFVTFGFHLFERWTKNAFHFIK